MRVFLNDYRREPLTVSLILYHNADNDHCVTWCTDRLPKRAGEISYVPPRGFSNYSNEVGFYGNTRPALSRSKMLSQMNSALRTSGIQYHEAQGENWEAMIEVGG